MADAISSEEPAVRTSKRKRNQVFYLADDYYEALGQHGDDDELVAENGNQAVPLAVDSDPEDSAFGSKVRSKDGCT